MLEQDVEAAYRGDPAAKSHHEIIFCYPGLDAITSYRLAHELYAAGGAVHPADDDRDRPRARPGIDIHPGRDDRAGVLHRPRHRRGDRRDDRDRPRT